jgi:uncharacterized membrane protein YGL010W
MKSIHQWLEEYAESHQNPLNKKVHWICVPLIMISIIGLLWSIPVPEPMAAYHLNFGIVLVIFSLAYYLLLSPLLMIGMLFVSAGFLTVIFYLSQIEFIPLWATCISIFVLAWVGQFYGHKVEGKKPSFLKDIQFLMIGPIWLLSFIYKRIGISY